jgi:hypothetical protein
VNGKELRVLTPDDVEAIVRLVGADSYDPEMLARELASEKDYLWMGIVDSYGAVHAVHRSMRWGRHLLLKGVIVGETVRGSGAALDLAFALRDAAREAGYAGIAAWVEPHEPEAGMAHLLRLRVRGRHLHRFEVPISNISDECVGEVPPQRADSGTITLDASRVPQGKPLVPDLLSADNAASSGGGGTALHWIVDRHRLVCSAFPLPSIADLPELILSLATSVRSAEVRHLEIPLPAADIPAALYLAGGKARRLSRTPVRLGRLDFPIAPPRPERSSVYARQAR